jgi:diacylglycerol kinase family enzyme
MSRGAARGSTVAAADAKVDGLGSSCEIRVSARSARTSLWLALLSGGLALLALVALVVKNFVTLLLVLLAVAVAGSAAWIALTRRGASRALAVAAAVASLAAGVAVLFTRDAVDELAIFVLAATVFIVLTRRSIDASVERARSSGRATGRRRATGRAVLLMNPKSGGGKVDRFALIDEARRRGIEPILLSPGDDLRTLARAAAGPAEVIGMAGGDGSQALVAEIAMEYGIAYVCVPAGTRNHLALDLGLDRGDVVGALDAFGSENEHLIDLAFVNDRIFVNNVSLGVYAQIVQSDAYRDAKLGTAEKMLPELLGPSAAPFDLRFVGPDGGAEKLAQLLLVSNNPYALERLLVPGSRPRLDTGRLGVVAVEIENAIDAAELVTLETVGQARLFRGWTQWSPEHFEVASGAPIAAGIDGEAAVLEPPLRFRIAPAALRVRLPPAATGLSPAARRPGLAESLRELWTSARS